VEVISIGLILKNTQHRPERVSIAMALITPADGKKPIQLSARARAGSIAIRENLAAIQKDIQFLVLHPLRVDPMMLKCSSLIKLSENARPSRH
jgi:hypothetical protein